MSPLKFKDTLNNKLDDNEKKVLSLMKQEYVNLKTELIRTISYENKEMFEYSNTIPRFKLNYMQRAEAETKYVNKIRNMKILIGNMIRMVLKKDYSKLTDSMKEVSEGLQMAEPASSEAIIAFFKEKRGEVRVEQEKEKEEKMTSMYKSPTSLAQSSKMLKLVTNNILHS